MADTPAVNKSQSNVVDDFLAALFASNPTPTMEKKPQNQPKSPQQETATITTTSTTSITPKQIDNDQQGGTAAAGTTKRAEILDEFDEYEMLSKRKHESKDSTANARKGGKAGSKPKKAAKKAWPEARLLVRGIPHTARKHDVLKHFNKYGNIVESHIGGNGIDYIQFDSPDSCTAALAENGTNIKGSAIELDIAANARPFIDYENSTQQHPQVPFRTGNKFSSRGGGNAHMGRGRGRGRGAGHFQPYSIQQQQVPEYDPTDYSMWNGGYRENYSNQQQQQQQQQQPLYENNSYRGKRGGRQGMRGGGRGKPKGIMARQQHQRHSSPIPRHDSLSILQNRDAPMIQVLAYGHVDQGFINYVESSFAIRHITTHTLFVQYGQVSREEIVKQLILQGVRALVVLDQGKESMRKLYLQVFERNATGANSYRFDEYDSVSVDEAIAIIERSQQTNGQPPQSTSAATSTAQAAYQAQQLLMQQQQQQQQQQQPLSTQAQAISNIDPNTLASVIGLLKNMVQPTTQQQQQQPAPAPVPVASLGNPTYPSQQPMAQPNPAASLSQLQQLLGSALGTSFPQSSSNMTVPSAAPFNQIPITFPSTQPSQHVPSPAYPPPQQQQPMTSIPTSAPNISVSDLLQKLQSFTQQQMQHQ